MENNNYFEKLNNVNVSDKTEEKNGLTYLSWSYAWGEIKKQHPQAQYKVYENADGWNYFTDGKTAWVKTSVTVEGLEHIDYLPIMDTRNRSIPVANITSFDVNKAIQRSITKACARHGLGLYIYAGEDLPEIEQPTEPQPKAAQKPKAAPSVPENDLVPPTEEQVKELEALGGTLEKVSEYFKVASFLVTGDMVQTLIDRKKKILANKEKAKTEGTND